MSLYRIHYLSGMVLATFITLHLVNHAVSVAGIDEHLAMMDLLRHLYRNILVELVLMFCIVIQISSGLVFFRTRKRPVTSWFDRLQFASGLYLAMFLIIHVVAVMTGRFLLGLDTNYYFGVAGINLYPFNLFFIPYYALAIMAFFGHIACAHRRNMHASILGMNPHHQAIAILIMGIVFTVLIFYGLTNGFTGVEIPAEYKGMFDQ